ncbi:MAG TPA: FKBP-type peptidyl-prolyl cis-trans isomerase N-terminal domain-containing protein, partial [Pirellulales bacterium]|nr:FKBP-type peptidyl-prolyl cis-trans isomerase N-terminal domain-containing protein [Pirellulales bacterium]
MKVFCLGALGLGLCIGLLAAAEPASKKSKDDQRVISNATGGDESAADEETAADEESGEEPDDDDESKPAKKDDDSRPEVKKKPPVRGLAAKDQELVKKANYMVAAQWAQGLSSEGFEFDLDEVVRGIKDALGGKAQAFTPEEYKECLLVMQQKMVENKDKRSKLFLEENKKK